MESDRRSNVVRVANTGPIWFIGWLFTIAFAQLVWWKALLAIVFWPYYLGLALR